MPDWKSEELEIRSEGESSKDENSGVPLRIANF